MRRFFRVWKAGICLLACLAPAGAKERADWLITARYVVTMDGGRRVIPDGAVAILGTRIAGVGTRADMEKQFEAAHTLNKQDALLAPGLIDTHTHAPMSLMRSIASDVRLEEWLTKYIFPAESRNVSPEFVSWGTRLACLEMVLAGITTYTDMYYFEDTEAEAAKEAGVRGVLGQSVIGFPAPDFKSWQEGVAGAETFIRKWRGDDLITPAVAPHAIYTTPNEALRAAHGLAVKYNVPLLIHLAETQKERDDAVRTRGMTPAAVLEKLHVLDGRVVAAHSIWMSDSDLEILQRHHTGVAHCPSSNTKLAEGVARVTQMLKLGIDVGVGNDGFAGSNDSADLFREMNFAAKLQKVTVNDPTVLPAEQTFAMGTIGGARALGMQDSIGSLEVGKRADLIAVTLAHSNTIPMYQLYPVLVYGVRAGDVEDVFINGRQVVKSREVLTLNARDILQKAGEWQRRIQASLGK